VAGSADPAPVSAPDPLVWRWPSLGIQQTVTATFAVRVADISRTLAITNMAYAASGETIITRSNTIVNPFRPMAITLLSFTASPSWDGEAGVYRVAVRWVTGVEIDTFGFHILRSEDGTRAGAVPVTPAMIPGRGGQAGNSYEWIDPGVWRGRTYTYWLVEMELNGNSVEYGPASARVPLLGEQRLYLPMIARQ
jgi:hypothetical protein